MRTLTLAAGLVASLAMTAVSVPAGAQPYEHHHRYHHHHASSGCVRRNHKAGVIGAIGGGIGGAAIGGALTHGNGPSMLLGAGAGALAGNAIGRNSHRC